MGRGSCHALIFLWQMKLGSGIIYHKIKTVCLSTQDETNCNLTEGVVMKQILDFLSDITVLAIVHRFTNIQNFDRILVFRDGEIVGQGTFDELMQTNEYFAKLYRCSIEEQVKL